MSVRTIERPAAPGSLIASALRHPLVGLWFVFAAGCMGGSGTDAGVEGPDDGPLDGQGDRSDGRAASERDAGDEDVVPDQLGDGMNADAEARCGSYVGIPRPLGPGARYDCDGRAHTRLDFALGNFGDAPIQVDVTVDGEIRYRVATAPLLGWQRRTLVVAQGVHTYEFVAAGTGTSAQVGALVGSEVSPVRAKDGRIDIGYDFIPPELGGAWVIDDLAGPPEDPVSIHPPWMAPGATAVLNVDCSDVPHARLSLKGRMHGLTAPVMLAADGVDVSAVDFPDDGDWHWLHFDVEAGPHTYTLTARALTEGAPPVALTSLHCSPGGDAPAGDGDGDAPLGDGDGGPPDGGADASVAVPGGGRDLDSAWLRQFGTAASERGHALAVDKDGNVLVVGNTKGDLSGEGNAGDSDGYATKLSGVDGQVLWTRQFGTPSLDEATAVGVDAVGDVYITGNTHGDLAGAGKGGLLDAYVMKLAGADGRQLWIQQFGAGDSEQGMSLAIADGHLFVLGYTTRHVASPAYQTRATPFVARLSTSDGTIAWTQEFGPGTAVDVIYASALDDAGDIVVAGDTVDLDPLGNPTNADALVMKLSGVDGSTQWTRRLATDERDFGRGVALDGAGNVYVAGLTDGNLQPGSTAAKFDAFVAKLSHATGSTLWVRQFGSLVNDEACCVVVDGAGQLLVAGKTLGDLDGWGNLGASDAFLMRLSSADGSPLWARHVGSKGAETARALALDNAGDLFLSGETTGDLSGEGNAGNDDAFVLKTTPPP